MPQFDDRRSDLQSDFDSLRPGDSTEQGATRRTALKAAIGVGYAAAVMPVMAQTAISTPADGLKAGPIKYTVNGFEVPAYAAAPANKTGLPVILVVQEIFGVHEYIADTCRRFAKLGYLAIAPELYARQGDPRGYTDIPKLQADIVSKVPDAQVLADLDGALQYAAANGGDTSKAGITGFCWGGRITWLYAAHNPNLTVGVAWYGRVVGQPNERQPRNPVDLAAAIKAPVLGLYGGADQGIPNDTVEQMRAALRTAGKTFDFMIYPDTPHAFHADYRATYRKAQAEDGWAKMHAWFVRHGLG